MRLRTKVIIIIVSILLVSLLVFSIVLGVLFNKFIDSEERQQIGSIRENLSSYMNQQQVKYLEIANEWAHSSTTFDFMEGNDSYIDDYLTRKNFVDLDVNFMLYNYNFDWIYMLRYYDFDDGYFGNAQSEFEADITRVFPIVDQKDEMSSVFMIDEEYYFIASSNITDPLKQQTSNGKLILGRLIDFSYIENITGSKLIDIESVVSSTEIVKDTQSYNADSKDKEKMVFKCVIPGEMDSVSLVFTFEKQRDIYIQRIDERNKIRASGYLSLIGIALLVYLFLEILVIKPYGKVLKGVRKSKNNSSAMLEDSLNDEVAYMSSAMLEDNTNDEVAYLSSAVDSQIAHISNEQNKALLELDSLYLSMKHLADSVIVVGKDGMVKYINLTAKKLTGVDKCSTGIRFDDLIEFADESAGENNKSPIEKSFETRRGTRLSEHKIIVLKQHKKIDIEYTVSPIIDINGKMLSCVFVFHDCKKIKEKQRQTEYLSYHDELTKLYNRRYFEEELKRLDAKRNLPISLVFADANGLKIMNDAFGHDVGDQLLLKVSKVIREMCRTDEIIARVGGDEFVILLTRTDKKSAEKLVNRILEKIDRISIMGIKISLAFGWDTKVSEDVSVWEVLRNAEDAMYRNKILLNPNIRRNMIKNVLKTLYDKSGVEKEHSKKVSSLCVAIGRALNMKEDELEELKAAGFLHDIGKVGIDMKLLNSTGILSETDWMRLRSHSEKGYRILNTSSGFYGIAEYVLMHHERWDGTGYPKGLAGEKIHLYARIIAIADAFDSMTRQLPYSKDVLTIDQAIAELKRCSAKQFDSVLVRIFVEKVLKRKY